ncbi:MAG: Asp-tRNA(Asn)/Glu-tRNA(Gln) amidotransferase subunit GatB, partial [Saprospiraceae bacterium]
MSDKYEVVVGLEIHVQLDTKSKAFCADENSFGGEPNTKVSAISLAHPGTLPVPNMKQIEYAIRLGLALDCEINRHVYFDRKNYTYPDLPKGYQITQENEPICLGGTIKIQTNGKEKSIRLNRIHMEEDAGKSVHDIYDEYSCIDLNRAGTPLLEIVTEPDISSGEEALLVMAEIRKLVRYIGVSDGNMEQGSMRCDCNISLRKKGVEEYGTRCEIKNVNSMRNAMKAIEAEAKRQEKILLEGGEIEQQTRAYDVEGDHTNRVLRSKENAHDYRYFPEPDMPPLHVDESMLNRIRKEMPELPQELLLRLQSEFGLSEYDAKILTEDKATADFYLDLMSISKHKKQAANLVINRIKGYLKEAQIKIEDFDYPKKNLAELVDLIAADKLSTSIAYQRIFPKMLENTGQSPTEMAQGMGLIQDASEDFLT